MPSSKDTQMMGDQNRFPTTSWNLVRTAKKVEALDTLIQVYWKPLYFFVRQHGYDNENSKDMVQSFLTTLMQRDAISKAGATRRRFRSSRSAVCASISATVRCSSTGKRST